MSTVKDVQKAFVITDVVDIKETLISLSKGFEKEVQVSVKKTMTEVGSKYRWVAKRWTSNSGARKTATFVQYDLIDLPAGGYYVIETSYTEHLYDPKITSKEVIIGSPKGSCAITHNGEFYVLHYNGSTEVLRVEYDYSLSIIAAERIVGMH